MRGTMIEAWAANSMMTQWKLGAKTAESRATLNSWFERASEAQIDNDDPPRSLVGPDSATRPLLGRAHWQ